MTLTLSGIARGRLVLFTASGAAKQPAMQAIADGADLPAARVRAPCVVWLVDRGRRSPLNGPGGAGPGPHRGP